MSIKNKDGSVYKLQSPNPLVKEQKWDLLEDDLILHNFDWDGVIIPSAEDLVPINSDFSTANAIIFPDATVVAPKPSEPEKQVFEKTEETPKLAELEKAVPEEKQISQPSGNIKNIVTLHCLPGTIRRHEDSLYTDVYSTIEYGEKFSFEGVIVQRLDLGMLFWTNVELSEGSIVFPVRYRDGVKFGEYRWWKVESMEKKANGYLVHTTVSDHQPDFSD